MLVSRRLGASGSALDAYAPVFDRAIALNAKSLISLMVLPFALLLPLVFYRRHHPFVVHVVFSVHLFTFTLLLFCIALALSQLDVWRGGSGLRSPRVDDALTVSILLASAAYLYLAIGRVYAARGALRTVQAATLALAMGSLVLAYRFALFMITLYST